MSSITISGIWTMDPGDVWTPVSAFAFNDPFGVAMLIDCSEDLVDDKVFVDAQWHLVNPREDVYDAAWWTDWDGSVYFINTVDTQWLKAPVVGTSVLYWSAWKTYADAFPNIGAAKIGGVFALRGGVQVRDTDLFAMTDPYAFKYALREDWVKAVQP